MTAAADRQRQLGAVMRGTAAVVACALLALTAWQYAMPASFQSSWRLNHAAVDHFRAALSLPAFAVGDGPYRWGFRGMLLAAWAAYFVMLFCALLGGRLPRALGAPLVGALALVLAVLWPASLSTDVYGYVGYGRLHVVHGVNPYLATQRALVDLGDPTAHFLRWGIASPYGPLWTWISAACVALLRHVSLWATVVAMKLVAGAAVLAAAFAGRALAERLEPGRGDATFAAIGMNPLFLIEAAGNGHNDLVMMALVLAALAAVADGRARTAALAVGVAGAVKFIPLLLLPWIAAEGLVARRGRRELGNAALVLLVGLVPLALSFAPLWHGGTTLHGLRERWARGQALNGAAGAGLAAKNALLVAGYLATSAWVIARRGVGRLVSGWIVASGAVLVMATGVWLPWYLAWPWTASLARWDARHLAASYIVFCFAVVFTFRYSVVLGAG